MTDEIGTIQIGKTHEIGTVQVGKTHDIGTVVLPVATPVVPWSPSDLGANLKRWWDFSDDSTVWQDTSATTAAASGDPIGRIDDKSGEGAHLLQSTPSNKPTRSAAGFNGTVAASFDGVDDWLKTSVASLTSYGGDRSMFVVVQCDGTEGVLTSGRSNTDYTILNFSGVAGHTRLFNGAAMVGSGSPTNTSWVAEFQINTSGDEKILADNVQLNAANAGDTATGLDFTVGDDVGTYNKFFGGYIGEIIQVSKILSGTERTEMYNYLNSKWGT